MPADPSLRLALGLAASAVLPSLVYLALRRSPARRPAQRFAAWSCLWAGQLVVPLVLVAWLSLGFGRDVHRLGSLLAALVLGGGGAAVAAMAAVQAARLLQIGVSLARGGSVVTAVRGCARVVVGALASVLAVAALFGLMMVIPIPGRFGPIVYLLVVLAPLGLASMIVLLVGLASRAFLRR
jgi:hypothetical protein